MMTVSTTFTDGWTIYRHHCLTDTEPADLSSFFATLVGLIRWIEMEQSSLHTAINLTDYRTKYSITNLSLLSSILWICQLKRSTRLQCKV